MLARNPILSQCPLSAVWLHYIRLDTARIPVALNSSDCYNMSLGAICCCSNYRNV